MKTITLPYWGQIIGVVSQTLKKDNRSLFITRTLPTQNAVLYILDNKGEQFVLSSTALPCAMHAIIKADADTLLLLGADGHLYQTDWHAKQIIAVSVHPLPEALRLLGHKVEGNFTDRQPISMALLTNSRSDNQDADNHTHSLAILYPQHIITWVYQHTAAMPHVTYHDLTNSSPDTDTDTGANPSHVTPATTLATSNDGQWLVIGDQKGTISSYQYQHEHKKNLPSLTHCSRQQIHQGAVSVLCFEPIGPYFFSAGADKNLYRMHVQGKLQPIDRAKSSQHQQMITALCVSDTRLFSAADDNSIKSWAFDKGQPKTGKEDFLNTRALCLSSYAEHAALIAISADHSLRFVRIERTNDNQNSLSVACLIQDGYQRVKDLLTSADESAFKEGLALLYTQADVQNLDSVERILMRHKANGSTISASRALSLVHWVASTSLNKTTALLERQLDSAHSSPLRLTAFSALAEKSCHSSRPLQYLEKALNSTYEEIIAAALQGYLQVAMASHTQQRHILPILQQALSHHMPNIRKQALASLEQLLPCDSPRADFMALEARYSDMIQAGLIRLYQRDFLHLPEVTRQILRLQSDNDNEVRQTAFYVSILSHPKLTAALKQAVNAIEDIPLLRTLSDFDTFDLRRGTLLDNAILDAETETLGVTSSDTIEKKSKTKSAKGKAVKTPITLSTDEVNPLLQGLSNRHADIGFRAAYALACLQDKRAFGTLVRLMQHKDSSIRSGVAAALGTLNMADAKAVLPALLNDKDTAVRQVAMQAFGQLAEHPLAWVAAGFATAHQDIHEQALAIFLTQVLASEASAKISPKKTQTAADMTNILRQALNNPFTSIRLEVVKVLLNRERHSASENTILDIIKRLQPSLFEDVHQVAIEEWQRLLLAHKSAATAKKPAAIPEENPHSAVLTHLLSDTFTAIRHQAFAIALKNRKVIPFTLQMRCALASPYKDIKTLALNTVQTQANNRQRQELLPALIGLLNEDSIELRQQALDVVLSLSDLHTGTFFSAAPSDDIQNTNHHNEALLNTALNSPYPDIQLTVAQLLASQPHNHKQANDARAYAVFERYLNTTMPTTAKNSTDYKQWHAHVSRALQGLAALANPSQYHALEWYAKYLHHPDADFSDLAPNLMSLIVSNKQDNTAQQKRDIVAEWQQDDRPLISQSASLALAVCGDSRGSVIFQTKNKLRAPLNLIHWLQGRQGLGITHAYQLQSLLTSDTYAPAARLLLIFNDLQDLQQPDTNQKPQRLIEALSVVDNETAVVYAHVLARCPNTTANSSSGTPDLSPIWHYLSTYLARQVGKILSHYPSVANSHASHFAQNIQKTSESKGKTHQESLRNLVLKAVSVPVLQQLAALSTHQQPLIRAQAVAVVCHLSEWMSLDEYEDDEAVWRTLQQWQRRLHALWGAHGEVITQTDPHPTTFVEEKRANTALQSQTHYPYQTLAFGAWLGVVGASQHSTDSAIRGLIWLASQPIDKHLNWQESVSRALLPLLNHPHFDTRQLVWEGLGALDTSAEKRAEYAMSTQHLDMLKQGLHLLLNTVEGNTPSDTADANSAANQQLITRLQTHDHALAEAAYRLLKQRLGLLPASLLGLNSYSTRLQHHIVNEWRQVSVSPFPDNDASLSTTAAQNRQQKQDFLLQAMSHDEQSIRHGALLQVVDFHELLFADHTIIEALGNLWDEANQNSIQTDILNLISQMLTLYQRLVDSNNEGQTPEASAFYVATKETADAIAHRAYTQLLGWLDAPSLKISKTYIYRYLGKLRATPLVEPLLQRLGQSYEQSSLKNERQPLFETLLSISGYDQRILDYQGIYEDERWLQRQHPRQSELLLSLFTTLLRYGDYTQAATLLSALAWAKAPTFSIKDAIKKPIALHTAIDKALALAYAQLPAKYSAALVKSVAYRATKRHGDVAVLQQALSSKQVEVPFLAAEALALCGQPQGLNILMSTIDYHPEAPLRRRSVLALGELMGNFQTDSAQINNTLNHQDKNAHLHRLYKAYDKLITLAEDEQHYLQDVASEALGRLAQGAHFEHSQHIFELLKAHLTDPNLSAHHAGIVHWLNGLRWLGSPAAWEQIRYYIRQYLKQEQLFTAQIHAIHLLQFGDTPANKALLLDVLQHQHAKPEALIMAHAAAQKLWGNENTEVYPYDWASMLSHSEPFAQKTDDISLTRVINNSSITALTDFITTHGEHLSVQRFIRLKNALLAKENMPKAQLRAIITNITTNDSPIADIGLRYLTQYPNVYLNLDMFAAVQQRFESTTQHWHTLMERLNHSSSMIHDDTWRDKVARVASTIEHIIWLQVRYLPIQATAKQTTLQDTGIEPISALIEWLKSTSQLSLLHLVPLLSAALSDWWQQALLALLARPPADNRLLLPLLPTLHAIANAQSQPISHSNLKLLSTLITMLETTPENNDAPLVSAPSTLETIDISTNTENTTQLLHWMKTKNASALYACARGEHSDFTVRVRAIEALGQLPMPDIEHWLNTLMTDHDADIQKRAYNVLRRWQRAQVLAQKKRPTAWVNIAESAKEITNDY